MSILTTFLIGTVTGGVTYELFKQRTLITSPRLWWRRRKQTATISKPDDSSIITLDTIRKDRLETIHGIGPVYAHRLNDAGIFTYADLAQAAPDQLIPIVAVEGSITPDIAAWIAEATMLAAKNIT